MNFKMIQTFRRLSDNGTDTKRIYTVGTASMCGWNMPHVGRRALRALEVGETVTDDDGDQWERIE